MATKKKPTGRKTATRKSTARKGAAKKTTVKKKTARKPAAKKKTTTRKKRQPNAAFMRPVQPSSELSQVVGAMALPRTEITKRLWAYIKRNGLQDQVNKRMINADDKLRAIFGGRNQVSMSEMTKLVSRHLTA